MTLAMSFDLFPKAACKNTVGFNISMITAKPRQRR